MKRSLILITFAAIMLFSTIALADVPEMINYQGRLTDSGGDPVNGTVSITFTIYDDSTGGTVYWTETHATVQVTNGLFNVILGSTEPLVDTVFADPERYLGIAVGGDPEIEPRTRLVSVGYSHRVSTVDGSTGGIISGGVSIQSNLTVSGKATIGSGHTSSGPYAFVAGENNTASSISTTVGGGEGNTASDSYSTVPGGKDNHADGDYSFAAGRRAKAIHNGAFVWADQTNEDFSSTASDQFLIRAAGGVGIGTGSPAAELDVNSSADALRLRAGESEAGSTKNQILFSYGGGVNYTHAIKSRHSSGGDDDNAIDFYVWDYGTDANGDIGTKQIMTLIGTESGRVGIGTTNPSVELHVVGGICYTGTIGACSDVRYKKDIEQIGAALETITQMRGVSYNWKQDEYPNQKFDDQTHLGFVAQEIKDLLPSVVMTDDNGYMSVDYSRLTPVLVEAMKELKTENDELRSELSEIKVLLQQLIDNQ